MLMQIRKIKVKQKKTNRGRSGRKVEVHLNVKLRSIDWNAKPSSSTSSWSPKSQFSEA